MAAPWPFAPERVELSDETQRLCAARFVPLASPGPFWLRSVGTLDALWALGLWLRPERPPADSPVVLALGACATTLAPSPRLLVPALVLRAVRGSRPRFVRVRQLLDGEWNELAELHAALGGSDRLESLRELFHDELLETRVGSTDRETATRATADAWARIDRSGETAAFARAIADVSLRRVPDPAAGYGAWQPAVAAACAAALPGGQAPAWLWLMLSASPGFDAGVGPFSAPDTAAAARALHAAANRLVTIDGPWRGDPAWPAVQALAAAPLGAYAGMAHMEAARALDEAGQPARAWDALASATFWASLARRPITEIGHVARWLAGKNGWSHLSEGESE